MINPNEAFKNIHTDTVKTYVWFVYVVLYIRCKVCGMKDHIEIEIGEQWRPAVFECPSCHENDWYWYVITNE